MKHLKQPIARRANQEDGVKGHFFEQRFYSGALLDEEAVLAAMAYVDLNPIRAKLADRLSECQDASIGERLRVNRAQALDEFLAPLASGLGDAQNSGDGALSAAGGEVVEPDETTSHTSRPMTATRIRMTLRATSNCLRGSCQRNPSTPKAGDRIRPPAGWHGWCLCANASGPTGGRVLSLSG